MTKNLSNPLAIGKYRPIYLWAGPGTIRMNRLKFLNSEVDEKVHLEAHTLKGAKQVTEDIYSNWAHLTYNWGFPPEVEIEDWQSFEKAAQAYHQLGSPVMAYIQTSNCVNAGSFKEKEWYALDPHGKKITYFTYGGRYMTCLNSEAWKVHLKEMVTGAIQRGADGIMFDNLFFGAQPLSLFNAWLGWAGCYCSTCREIYHKEFGRTLPEDIQSGDEKVVQYLRWRTSRIAELIKDLADYSRYLNPKIIISANDFDPVLRNSYLIYGINLEVLSQIQDIVMIENYGLPKWETGAKPRLANNALTLRTARSIIEDSAHLSVISYDIGIGFDDVYPVRRYLQGICEAAALGVSTTIKGTEYYDGRKFTLLTAEEYIPVQVNIGKYLRWLEKNAEIYCTPRSNLAPVGLLFPEERLWIKWHQLAPLYFGAGQVLTAEGIPWQVVRTRDLISHHLQVLLIFDDEMLRESTLPEKIKCIFVPGLKNWDYPSNSLVNKSRFLRYPVRSGSAILMKGYSQIKLFRQIADKLGLQKIVTQSPFYFLPDYQKQKTLIEAIPNDIYPKVFAKSPVLVEVWDTLDGKQIHLVNYDSYPQQVEVLFNKPTEGMRYSPENEINEAFNTDVLKLELDIYQVLMVSK